VLLADAAAACSASCSGGKVSFDSNAKVNANVRIVAAVDVVTLFPVVLRPIDKNQHRKNFKKMQQHIVFILLSSALLYCSPPPEATFIVMYLLLLLLLLLLVMIIVVLTTDC
jgi:hypothetical protein